MSRENDPQQLCTLAIFRSGSGTSTPPPQACALEVVHCTPQRYTKKCGSYRDATLVDVSGVVLQQARHGLE